MVETVVFLDGNPTNYRISEKGVVRNAKTDKVLKPSIANTGYYHVKLSFKGNSFDRYIHRLVAEAFFGIVEGKDIVNHKNGDKLDNSVENLEWVTQGENMKHWALSRSKKE